MRNGWFQRKVMQVLQRHFGLNFYRVLVRTLEPAAAGAAPAAIRFALLEEAELLAHCRDPELELSAASVRDSFARGDVCAGALEGERLLGYAWFAFGATPESGGTWIDFAPGAIYTYRHFVRPGHRGRRIAAGLLPAADACAAQRGREICLTLIYTHNRASIRATERSGSRTVGYAACLRLFGRLLCWRSAGARRHALRFFRPQSNFRPFSLAMRRLASMLAATTSRN
jgi:GNAT superfamily N-acetyltransferase